MNKLEAKALLPLIKAFSEGKQIQCKNSIGTEEWEDLRTIEPQWSMHPSKYRIKPEPKTVPLTIEDLYEHFKKGTIFKSGIIHGNTWFQKIQSMNLKDDIICDGSDETVNSADFCKYNTFEDDSPLTKIVEE